MSFTIHLRMKKLGVRQYNARRDEGRISAWLTKEEIADQAARGKARIRALNAFFGVNAVKPVDGKYRFDTIGDEILQNAASSGY